MAKSKSPRPKNPFVSQGYISPEYFCDREQETDLMLSHFENGRNITLVSPRRIGKTGLIKNLFYHIDRQDKGAICLYLDIYATKNLQDFTEMFAVDVIDVPSPFYRIVDQQRLLVLDAFGFVLLFVLVFFTQACIDGAKNGLHPLEGVTAHSLIIAYGQKSRKQ